MIGYAATAGFGLLTKASGADFTLPIGPFTVMAISFLLGGAYGWDDPSYATSIIGSAVGQVTDLRLQDDDGDRAGSTT